jgi:hypothetical protein
MHSKPELDLWMPLSFFPVCPYVMVSIVLLASTAAWQTITFLANNNIVMGIRTRAPCSLTWLRVAGHVASGASRWATHQGRQFPVVALYATVVGPGLHSAAAWTLGGGRPGPGLGTRLQRLAIDGPGRCLFSQHPNYHPFRWPSAKVIASYFVPEK